MADSRQGDGGAAVVPVPMGGSEWARAPCGPGDLLGRVAVSKSGRDAGKPMAVLACSECGRWAWVADGRLRKADRPKKKNMRHLRFTGETIGDARAALLAGSVPTDAKLRAMLEKENLCQKTSRPKRNR